MNDNKEQQLTFGFGITNVPGDATCDDNTLEECVGLTYADGEHRVIQRPVPMLTLHEDMTLLYVHSYNNVTRYIVKYKDNGEDYVGCMYKKTNEETYTNYELFPLNDGKVLVESVGNSLIIATSSGLNYLLWDYTKQHYKILGNKVPDIQVVFSLDDFTNDLEYATRYIRMDGMVEGRVIVPASLVHAGVSGNVFVQGKYDDAKTALIGLVASRLRTVKSKYRFAFPFWARSAIRMYDGSHINISNPTLLLPTVTNNADIFVCEEETGNIRTGYDDDDEGAFIGGVPYTNYKPWSAKLYYQVIVPDDVNLSEWTDIISGIDIFVSEEAKNFDMEGDWVIRNAGDTAYVDNATLADCCEPGYKVEMHSPTFNVLDETTLARYYSPSTYSEMDIISKLISNSVFYRIIELGLGDISSGVRIDASTKMTRSALENLTTQTQLEYDDYFSRTNIVPQVLKTYNNRLHMANVTRDFFAGFTRFSFTSYAAYSGQTNLSFYVYIRSESGERIVNATSYAIPEIADIWFYYPDPRAYKVRIYASEGIGIQDGLIRELSLKEHPYLNGAYYFKRLPGPNETITTTSSERPETNNTPELLKDQLIVSEVNNPYIFTAKGYTKIFGNIIGLASQTMALGEQEHGIHPLTVFTEKGISLLRLQNDGTYVRSDEISREVANKSNPCIVETDGPVFFASERGLMVLTGSEVKCVSEQLSGRAYGSYLCDVPFATFLKNAFIAYDYRDSLLWIFNPNSGFDETCWVYNIKSGTFSQYEFGAAVSNVVNSYPDYLLQAGTQVYSLMNRPNINADNATYQAMMTSRPMKLENGLALKSIMRMRNIKDMDGTLTVTIKASNELAGPWTTLTSLRGRPWKYYKFRYDFAGLKATDRFAGTVIVTQERRTNKLR